MTSLPEGRPERTFLSRVTHWTYILVLVSVFAYLAYIGLTRVIYFKGTGIVEVDKTNLSPVYGGEVISLKVKPGDKVERNQVLATIMPAKNCRTNMVAAYKLKHDILLLKLKKDMLAKQIAATYAGGDNYLRRALEIEIADSYRRNSGANSVDQLQSDLSMLDTEISIKDRYLRQIKKTAGITIVNKCANENIKAPFRGSVYAISAKLNEFVQRGKPLLTLVEETQKAKIEAYLSNDYLEYLHVGKELMISFPDQTQSSGIIEKIESNATLASARKWHGYDPVKTRVRATITPVAKQDDINWIYYDRMFVEIKGSK